METTIRLGPYIDIIAEDILARVRARGGEGTLEVSNDRAFFTVLVSKIPPGYEVRTRGENLPRHPDAIPW